MDEEEEEVISAKLASGVLWASVGGDPKSVKHFTGLKKGAFKWVMDELTKAVCGRCFFRTLSFHGSCVFTGCAECA